jgi:hippurate hydrolase
MKPPASTHALAVAVLAVALPAAAALVPAAARADDVAAAAPDSGRATSTRMDVVVRGVGGHGSRPDQARDPVVLAANIVLQLQTIVSREVSPSDRAVVTVGTIRGGTQRDVIADEVLLELEIRTYREDVRQRIIESVARISRAAALGAGMPEDRLPEVRVVGTGFAPTMEHAAPPGDTAPAAKP